MVVLPAELRAAHTVRSPVCDALSQSRWRPVPDTPRGAQRGAQRSSVCLFALRERDSLRIADVHPAAGCRQRAAEGAAWPLAARGACSIDAQRPQRSIPGLSGHSIRGAEERRPRRRCVARTGPRRHGRSDLKARVHGAGSYLGTHGTHGKPHGGQHGKQRGEHGCSRLQYFGTVCGRWSAWSSAVGAAACDSWGLVRGRAEQPSRHSRRGSQRASIWCRPFRAACGGGGIDSSSFATAPCSPGGGAATASFVPRVISIDTQQQQQQRR